MKRFAVLSLLLVLLVVTAGCGLFTKNGTLIGTVTDEENGAKLANVKITVGTKTVTTNTQGQYSVELDEGSYDLTAKASGYDDYTTTVTIISKQEAVQNIEMSITDPAYITGTVVEGRGGAGVVGARVFYGGYFSETDVNGDFNLTVPSGVVNDILVTKDGQATTRVQDVTVAANETIDFEIPTRSAFSPNRSFEAPSMTLNVEPGQELSGTFTVVVKVDSVQPIYLHYVYLGGEQRYPYENSSVYAVDENEIEIDTTQFPNGDSYLRVLIYDDNDNAAIKIVPITINNTIDDTVLPGELTSLNLVSYNWGVNIFFYGKDLADRINSAHGLQLDVEDIRKDMDQINAAPEGACLYNRLTWTYDQGDAIDGFTVYRSFDHSNWEKIGDVAPEYLGSGRYDDWSAKLTVNTRVYYKVVPYNSFGVGNAMERNVYILPSFNTYLEAPANEATGISLTPKFTWYDDLSEEINTDIEVEMYYKLALWDATNYQILLAEIETTSLDLPGANALAPGGIYSWDISYSEMFTLCELDDYGYSYALSASGEYDGTGSVNGEFVFTTTTGLQ